MAWAGSGALFALDGGIASSIGLESAIAAPLRRTAVQPFTFVQLSDSHIGFNKPPNADARATFAEAIAKVKALPVQPDFVIHTGDVSQLSRDDEFDDADQMLKSLGLPVFFIPGEHDMRSSGPAREPLNQGDRFYQFDRSGAGAQRASIEAEEIEMSAEELLIIQTESLATPTDLGSDAVRDISGALNALLADMALWRERLFAWMLKSSESAMEFFKLPTNRVIELGSQVEI